MTAATDPTQERVRRVFERLDKAAATSPIREQLVSQVREVYAVTGEPLDEGMLQRAVDEVLAEEVQPNTVEMEPASVWSLMPAWAWPIAVVGFVVIAVPVARLLLMIVARLMRF